MIRTIAATLAAFALVSFSALAEDAKPAAAGKPADAKAADAKPVKAKKHHKMEKPSDVKPATRKLGRDNSACSRGFTSLVEPRCVCSRATRAEQRDRAADGGSWPHRLPRVMSLVSM